MGPRAPRAPGSPRGPALRRSETRAPTLRLTDSESPGAGRGLREDAVPRVPDPCPGWDAAPVTTASCVDGSRPKGDGSGNTAGLLPLSDSILWVSGEHSLFVLAPVGSTRTARGRGCVCFVYCRPAHLHVAGTTQQWGILGKPSGVWKELWSQVWLGSKLGPIYYEPGDLGGTLRLPH